MRVSGTVAGDGVPAAAEIEETKARRAGLVKGTERHRSNKFRRPEMCCASKLRTPMLKLTAQAEWMTDVSVEESAA